MKRKALIVLTAMAGLFGAAPPSAAEFAFGEETKGVTLAQGESDLTIRVRLQPRFDFGDIITSTGGDSYATESDMYFRRARLEMGGNLVSKKIKYNVTFDADKWDKAGNNNKISLKYAYVALTPDEAYSFMFGKEKLPYSREELISSSTLLFIERPASVDASRDVFGASNAYYQPKAAVFGKLFEGAIGYEVAVADGWQNGEAIQTGPTTVYKAAPLLATRVEISPTGWVETKKQGSYLGKGQHITAGVSLAVQKDIDYASGGGEDRTLWGVDVSTHLQGLTASAEYISWEVDSTLGKTRPEGWFLQAGYFMEELNIEPAARYEVFDENAKAADMKERTMTLGVNWYGKGHGLKVQANWAHTRFESNASGGLSNDKSRDILQIQGQLYF